MPLALFPSFLFYCFVSAITPGPANLCTLNAALRYGKKEAFKQWKGLFCGYALVSVTSVFVVYFFASVFTKYIKYFSFLGAGYILWLAIHILCSSQKLNDNEQHADCSFKNGFLVQIMNVKIIVFCISALSFYVVPYTDSFVILLLTGIFLPLTGPFANLVWLEAGAKLQNIYNKNLKASKVIMSASLLVCAVSLVV